MVENDLLCVISTLLQVLRISAHPTGCERVHTGLRHAADELPFCPCERGDDVVECRAAIIAVTDSRLELATLHASAAAVCARRRARSVDTMTTKQPPTDAARHFVNGPRNQRAARFDYAPSFVQGCGDATPC